MERRKATEFGKELRKIRVERDETLFDMARRLGISPSHLSLIERGGRRVPTDMAARVRKEYGLSGEESARLMASLDGATACQREALQR